MGRVILAKKPSAGALPAVLTRDFGLSCVPDCDARDARDVLAARDEAVAVLCGLAADLLGSVEEAFFAGADALRLIRLDGW